MNILSIHVGHNATAALILNNKLEISLSEEKFTNIKNYSGFPLNSIKYIMNTYNLNADNIDFVAIAGEYVPSVQIPDSKQHTNTSVTIEVYGLFFAALVSRYFGFTSPLFENLYTFYQKKIKKKFSQTATINLLKNLFGFRKDQIVFVHHHLCHSYAPIGFFNLHKQKEPVLIITQDGYGDTLAGMTGVYENGNYKLLSTTSFVDSTAWLYAAVTKYLGMKELEHEHKVMGLAAYPPKEYGMKVYKNKFEDLITVKDTKISLRYKTFLSGAYTYTVLRGRLYRERFDNIAFGIQQLIEDKITEFVRQNIEKYKIKKIAFGGGLFMNVKLNKKIQELPDIEKCYFMPSCGDEMNAVGAAFYVLEKQGEFGFSNETMYLGKEYSDEEIERFFRENELDKKYELEKSKNINKEVAQLVAEGNIVGRFAGRGEVGARSLGNRAILADPSKLESVEMINYAIKSRDFWMPFACSVLDSHFEDYAIFNGKSIPYYMITAYDTTEDGKKHLKAAIHRKDYTMRPNVVKINHNKEYWDLINEYRKLTGIGGILNTSLNIHGYPLIGFIRELFFTMDNSHLDISQCGNYIIRKKFKK
ncbi:MAG: carbamoyltransferase C-terminal domain-containing protein [Candidatus Bilamarchaeaceae archaeon]